MVSEGARAYHCCCCLQLRELVSYIQTTRARRLTPAREMCSSFIDWLAARGFLREDELWQLVNSVSLERYYSSVQEWGRKAAVPTWYDVTAVGFVGRPRYTARSSSNTAVLNPFSGGGAPTSVHCFADELLRRVLVYRRVRNATSNEISTLLQDRVTPASGFNKCCCRLRLFSAI